MATSSRLPEQSRPYQGYPFVSPVVIDVPTLDAATAAKWTNLPRRPITTPGPNVGRPKDSVNVNNEAASNGTGSSTPSGPDEKDLPRVYIDLPEEDVTSSSDRTNRGEENPGFVQDTIFFDPFENRQIGVHKPKDSTDNRPGQSAVSTPGSSSSRPSPVADSSARPNRPGYINLSSPGSYGTQSTPSPLPAFMNKESQVYGTPSSTEDGFSLTPLPVTDYPEPPPAYTEVATANRPAQEETPPRTVVVVPDSSPTVGLPSMNRKLAQCQNCTSRVHTVVVMESGAFTHFIALITVILCFLPLTVLIYCTNFFKYKVHFCPNCNHRIGYEIPILCQDMAYTS